MNEHREQIKKDNPNASVADQAKIGGDMWKVCADKSPWEEPGWAVLINSDSS